jgi:hypothetical protein
MTRNLLSAGLGALLLAGCNGGNDLRKTYPVAGTITIDGAPAEAGVLVLLHPQFTEQDKYPIHPRGATTEAGAFKITTYNADDGAPEGEYVATVEWPQRSGMSPHFTGDLFGGLFSKVEANKEKPEFKVNVTKQGAQLDLKLSLTPQQKSALEAAKKKAAAGGGGFNFKGD